MTLPNSSQRQRMRKAFEEAVQDEAGKATLPAAPEVALRAGQVIGKCAIVRELGRGGMGAVYLAKHLTLDVPVAVKVLPPSIGKQADYAERFLREARMVATLRHPNVLAVMDADKDPATGLYYMVTEFIDGGSIGDRVAKGALPEKACMQVVSGVAKALSAAEKQGIIHRDIKPANILVTKDGRVKLADLGLAKRAGQADITQSSAALGTPYYMSPEQIQDSKRVDIRSDIYSLGATFFHMMTGRPPFPGNDVYNVMHAVMTAPVPNPKEAKPDLSDSNAAICMRMLEKDASKRYQSPSEVLNDLSKGVIPGGIELEPAAPAAGAPLPPTPMGLSGSGRGATSPTLEQGRVVIDMSTEVRNSRHKTIQVGMALATMLIAFVFLVWKTMPRGTTVVIEKGPQAAADEPAPKTKGTSPSGERPGEKKPDPGEAKPPEEVVAEKPPGDKPPVKPADPKRRPALSDGCVLALTFNAEDLRVDDASRKAGKGYIVDVTGHGNDASKDRSTTFRTGRLGPPDQGLEFDGKGRASGDTTDGGVLTLPALEEKTIAFWFQCLERKAGIIYDGGSVDRPDQAFLVGVHLAESWDFWRQESDGVSVGFWGNDVVVPFRKVFDKGWHHLAVSWNGEKSVTVVVDGKVMPGQAYRGGILTDFENAATLSVKPSPVNGGRTLIGTSRKSGNAPLAGFHGFLDELAVWERALSEEELTSLAGYAAKKKSYCEEIARQVKEK